MRTRLHLFAISALILTISCAAADRTPAANGAIGAGARMNDARASHTATLLRDGRVLITGGMVENGIFLDSAELFDPKTGSFEKLPSMGERRVGHTATLLPDGRVVIAGGLSDREFVDGHWRGIMAKTIEVYDPAKRQFIKTGALITPRNSHAAVATVDGRVFFLGGDSRGDQLSSVESFDSRTGRSASAGTLATPRGGSGAVLLPNGYILLAGGSLDDRALNGTIEIYDPTKHSSRAVAQLHIPRYKHATVLLEDGRVLIVGGSDTRDWNGQLASAEIFDPARNTSTEACTMAEQRFKIMNAAVVLKDGTVLVAGGKPRAERFNPASRSFSTVAGDMNGPHYFSTATLLADGRVLIAGGYGNGTPSRGPLSTRESWIFAP